MLSIFYNVELFLLLLPLTRSLSMDKKPLTKRY